MSSKVVYQKLSNDKNELESVVQYIFFSFRAFLYNGSMKTNVVHQTIMQHLKRRK